MEGTENSKRNFVGYEYKEIAVDSRKVSLLLDGYESFGWQPDEIPYGTKENIYSPYQQKVVFHLKRNRKIVNKVELTRLQRNFEACVREIEELEKQKTSKATIYSLVLALAGTAFMAGSVFAVTAQPPQILLCILLAIPAFAGWIAPLFVYRKTVSAQTKRITPLIEEKYDEIYEICEKGNKLLY